MSSLFTYLPIFRSLYRILYSQNHRRLYCLCGVFRSKCVSVGLHICKMLMYVSATARNGQRDTLRKNGSDLHNIR